MEQKQHPSLLQDIRLIFASILTDPGSSLAYGADAVIAVTSVLLYHNHTTGSIVTITAGAVIMLVYLFAVLIYNSMTRYHVHPQLGGGAFVSALISAQKIRKPYAKALLRKMGKLGTASLLSDFPATQAISLIAGVEALYFIPTEQRFHYALLFLAFISFVQRYGLGNISRYLIWPVIAFYASNMLIQCAGLYELMIEGWQAPQIVLRENSGSYAFWPILLGAVANGATLITGVEVGYSSVNFPYHKGKAIRLSMWILYIIVFFTYSLQILNFLALGIDQRMYEEGAIPPVPIQIAQHLGGDYLALPFGLLTALMLLLAAQTAQSDFPLEILRASRNHFFPKGIGDTAWRKVRPAPVIGGHEGVYNPRATMLLGMLSIVILYFFPHSHDIESMYGLAVLTAICMDIGSYFLRQLFARLVVPLTLLTFLLMLFMLSNILYNKFFDGAWFIVMLMTLYLFVFAFSSMLYKIWQEKVDIVPTELGLYYPAFSNLPVDKKNIVLLSNFHPGVVHFLKSYVRSKHMPLVVHFQTDPSEKLPKALPPWFRNIPVQTDTDTLSAILRYVREHKPERVHLIPLLVRGINPIKNYYFGNSIEALKEAVSEYTDVQVEYNRERINIAAKEIWKQFLPYKSS